MNSMHYRLSISRCLPASTYINQHKLIQISNRWHTSNFNQFKLNRENLQGENQQTMQKQQAA